MSTCHVYLRPLLYLVFIWPYTAQPRLRACAQGSLWGRLGTKITVVELSSHIHGMGIHNDGMGVHQSQRQAGANPSRRRKGGFKDPDAEARRLKQFESEKEKDSFMRTHNAQGTSRRGDGSVEVGFR